MNPTAESPEAAALREQCLRLLGRAIADWRVATPAWAEKVSQLVDRYHEARRQQPTPTTVEGLIPELQNREPELEASSRGDASEATPATDEDLIRELEHREPKLEASRRAGDASEATPTTDEGLIRALKRREHELEASHRADDASEARRLHTALAEDLRDLAQNSDPAGLGKAASDRQTAIAFLERTGPR